MDRAVNDAPPREELLTVIVPCLNEEGAIASTIADILAIADALPLPVEVCMVDDGSKDGTRAEMQRLCEAHPRCRMRVNERNLGVGRSVLDTFPSVRPGSWVTVIPGDNEFRFSSIHKFLALRDRYDVILGYFGNPIIRPLVRRLSSQAFTKLACLVHGYSFRYLNGMKLYRVEAFAGIEVHSRGHAYNAELVAKAMLRDPTLRFGEAPFIARGRASGRSNAFRPKSILQAIRELKRGVEAVAAYREQVILEQPR